MFYGGKKLLAVGGLIFLSYAPAVSAAAGKTHVIAFGKSMTVQTGAEAAGAVAKEKAGTMKVRPLLVDGRVKEFALGSAHDVTDRLFVVRRAFRINDNLPQEASAPHWEWEAGGWLLVDRVTGRVSAVNLPEFDATHSEVSWYRDYAAYCGVSDDGKNEYEMVAEINRRKPMVKNLVKEEKSAKERGRAESCSDPVWQRNPTRVRFAGELAGEREYVIRGHAADLLSEDESGEEAEK